MKPGMLSRSVLFVSGAVAIGIGGSILIIPHTFLAAYSIEIAGQVSLENELRASGGALLAAGLLVLSGAFVSGFAPVAAAVGALVYLAYGLSRGLSVVLDGAPDSGLILAAWFELGIGLACLAVWSHSARLKRPVQ